MNHIGYREFRKDTIAVITDLHMKAAILYSISDGAEDERKILREASDTLIQSRTLIDVLLTLEHYEEVGHLFPPFS